MRIFALLVVLGFTLDARCLPAEDAIEGGVDAVDADAGAIRNQAIGWIDGFREIQVLFRDSDLILLRNDLTAGPPEKAARWWSRSARVRAVLESPQWAETREWFREFLRVQAMLSEEKLDALRGRAWEAAQSVSSRELREILAEVGSLRAGIASGSASDRAIRRYKLDALGAMRGSAGSGRAPAPAVQAAGFATNRAAVQQREPRYAPAPPLITSREVARWNVARIFWRW